MNQLLKTWWEWQPSLPHSCPLEHRHFTTYIYRQNGGLLCTRLYTYKKRLYKKWPIQFFNHGLPIESLILRDSFTITIKKVLWNKNDRQIRKKIRNRAHWVSSLFLIIINCNLYCNISSNHETPQAWTHAILYIPTIPLLLSFQNSTG